MICYLWTSYSIYSKINSLFCITLVNHLQIPDISVNISLVRFYFIAVTLVTGAARSLV